MIDSYNLSLKITIFHHLASLVTPNGDPWDTGLHSASVTCLATDVSLTADPGVREFDLGPVPYFRGD